MEITVNHLKDALNLAFGNKVVLTEGGILKDINEHAIRAAISNGTDDFLDYYIEVTPNPLDSDLWIFLRARRWGKRELTNLLDNGTLEAKIKKDKDDLVWSLIQGMIANMQPKGIIEDFKGDFSEALKNEEANFRYPSLVEQYVIRQYEAGLIKKL